MSEMNWLDMHKHATTLIEGDFPVVIVEATATKTNDQTKDMIKYKVKIESGPYVDRPITGNFTISPDSPVAMRILFGHWAILGLDQKFFAANPGASVEQLAQTLVGRRAVAKIGTRPWQGRDIEEIQEWKPALGGPGGGGSGLGGVLGGNGSLGGLASGPGAPSATSAPASSVPSPAAQVVAAQPKTEAPSLTF